MLYEESMIHEVCVNAPIRLLLVDDNQFFLDAASDFLYLHEKFHVVGTATNAQGALEQTRRLQPDVVLLDFNLGEESAVQLIPRLKECLPQTRIVVLTILEDDYRDVVLNHGADAFVRKPTMTETLLPSIADLYEPSTKPSTPSG